MSRVTVPNAGLTYFRFIASSCIGTINTYLQEGSGSVNLWAPIAVCEDDKNN